MIIDKIENIKSYKGLGENILKALQILSSENLAAKEDGKYDVQGDTIFYIVSRYDTKPLSESKFEAHKKYIDIQFMADGRELFGYAPTTDLKPECDYDSDNDFILFPAPKDFTKINFSKGMFAILFPEDGHMPCVQASGPENVCKIVFKVKIDA